MGLDMYAHRKLYVKRWEHQSPSESYAVRIERGGKSVDGVQSDRISGVEEEVMYWRKANHIHSWFVENVQDGVDNCAEYRIGWDELRALRDICQKVMEASYLVNGIQNSGTVYTKEHPQGMTARIPGKVIADATVAKELLPTREGFFFGSDEYDEDYLNYVIQTRDWAARMVSDSEAGVPGDIYYSSSW